MATVRYLQSNFTKGQIDQRLWASPDYQGYVYGCKQMRNLLPIPQRGFQQRFGTTGVSAALTETNAEYVDIITFIYDQSIIYLLEIQSQTINIYLENVLIATLTSTSYNQADIRNCYYTYYNNSIIFTNEFFVPALITRAANSPDTLTANDTPNSYLKVSGSYAVGQIYPVEFTTSSALPTTVPPVFTGRTYFIRIFVLSGGVNSFRVYTTSNDAAKNINYYAITNHGTSAHVVIQNTWSLGALTITLYPTYNFDGGYSAFNFTPSATSGANVTITSSSAIFTAALVGGLYQANGGSLRITSQDMSNPTTVIHGYTVEDFINTNAIPGTQVYLGEPAWSAARGYPRTCCIFQNRLFFGGSPSLPGGVWGSVTNDINDFDDSETLADNAISYYGLPYIVALTASDQLLVHTNIGTWSPPLVTQSPLTPTNFYLTSQNKDGVGSTPPVDIDNQVVYIDSDGQNVKNLVYDIIQSRYTLNNISAPSSDLINLPTDLTGYSNPAFVDGSYVIAVNADGTLAIFLTMLEQQIAGWSTADTSGGSFVRVATGLNRCWFIVQRTINGTAGLYIEELDFTTQLDASVWFNNVNSATLTGLGNLSMQVVTVVGDGNTLGEFTVSAGGVVLLPQNVTNAIVGLTIDKVFEPLPVVVGLQNGPNFYKPKHVRTFYVTYYNSYGVNVNDTPIPTTDMRNFVLGQPPIPTSGVYESTPMGDWDPFDPYADTLTINSDQPFAFTIVGIGYNLET